MAENSKIEWTDHTFNPWLGCTKVSPACDHCYAERDMDHRFGRVKWGHGQPRQKTSHANWQKPLAWNRKAEKEGRRYRVFCASLADVFDNEVPDEWRDELFALIAITPHLDWLLLTKRPQVARKYLTSADQARVPKMIGEDWPLPNVWLGVSVENQDMADTRIPILLDTPAAKRFLSCEPLLGPVDINAYLPSLRIDGKQVEWPDGAGVVDWIIAGGESGPKARPSHPDWFRSLRDQCASAGVPFLFKQWGEWLPHGQALVDGSINCLGQPDYRDRWHRFDDSDETETSWRIGKARAGRLLDGRTHDDIPGDHFRGVTKMVQGGESGR